MTQMMNSGYVFLFVEALFVAWSMCCCNVFSVQVVLMVPYFSVCGANIVMLSSFLCNVCIRQIASHAVQPI